MEKDSRKGKPDKDDIMFQELNPFELIEFIYLKSDIVEVNNALEKYIITVSSHPKIRDNPLANLPDYPEREFIASRYVKRIASLRIMQDIFRLKAEQSGKIDSLVNQEYYIRLRHRALELHKLLSKNGLFDLSKLSLSKFTLVSEAGDVRIMNSDRSQYSLNY